MHLVQNGKSRLIIHSWAPETFAAEELQRYIRLVSGVKLPVVKHEPAAGGLPSPGIFLMSGNFKLAVLSNRRYPSADGLRSRSPARNGYAVGVAGGPERQFSLRPNSSLPAWLKQIRAGPPGSYGLRTIPAGVVIAGRDYGGLVSGVYDFIETVLGVRFLEPDPGGEYVPRRATLAVPRLDRIEQPAFAYRGLPDASSMKEIHLDMLDWMAKNRLNYFQVLPWHWDQGHAQFGPELKKRGMQLSVFGHCTSHFFPMRPPQADAELKAHPEYYALVNGQRISSQICYSNPEVVRILSDNVAQWVRQYPEIESLGVGANDGSTFCECPRCKEIGLGRLLFEANRAIAEKVHRLNPEILVMHFNYPPGTKAPFPGVAPVKNLVGLYCPYGDEAKFERIYDYRHGVWMFLNEPQGNHRAICRNIRDWRRTHEMLVASYFSDQVMRPQTHMPYPDVIQDDLRYYRAIGVKGFLDVFCYRELWWLDTLNLRVFARMMWNPDADLAALLNDFYATYFGPAGGAMAAFDRLIGDLMRMPLMHGFRVYDFLRLETFGDNVKCLAKDFRPELEAPAWRAVTDWQAKARACLQEAGRLARTEKPLIRNRVARLKLCLDNLIGLLDATGQNVKVAWLAAEVAQEQDVAARRAKWLRLRSAIQQLDARYRQLNRSRRRWRTWRPPVAGIPVLASPRGRALLARYRQVLKEQVCPPLGGI